MAKKNIVQDVIPSKKSIRNVAIFPKAKRFEDEVPLRIEPTVQVNPITPPSYKYEYDEPKKSTKKVLYISIALLFIALVFGLSAFFKSAVIQITPKQEVLTLDGNFKASKNISTGGLAFQIVTTTKDIQKTAVSTGQEKVETKARGVIVVYNNTAQSQKLVATTRFQTLEGLIFRAVSGVTIPSQQTVNAKTVAGSMEVLVEADKAGSEYNVGLKDFTIPGFKGDAKYSKIYARSKTEMSLGYVGQQKVVSKEVMDKTDKELEELLKAELLKDIKSQIPENFILYQNGLFYDFQAVKQVVDSLSSNNQVGNVTLNKKGSISAIIFDKGSLSSAILAKVIPTVSSEMLKITNLDTLSFVLGGNNSFDPKTSTVLDFSLSGETNLVWVFDENNLKTELLGLSKNNAKTVTRAYASIEEVSVETYPFWNQTIPSDPKEVTIVNTLAK